MSTVADPLGEDVRVRGAAGGVDVAPVRGVGESRDGGAKAPEDLRGDAIGGAVGAIERHVQALQIELAEARVQLAQVVLRRAAQLDDLLEVSVYVGRVGTKSLRLNFEVRRKGERELIAEAHFVLVAVRRNTFESVPVPEELKRRLAPYTQTAPDENRKAET